jgi:hypothetical protein
MTSRWRTHVRHAHLVFIPHVHVLDRHLKVVQDLGDQRANESLRLRAFVCTLRMSVSVGKKAKHFTLLGSASEVEQLGVLDAVHLRSLRTLLLFRGIIVAGGRGHDEKVDVFHQHLHRLVAEVHPMQGQGEFAEMTCMFPRLSTSHMPVVGARTRTFNDVYRQPKLV